ncbi:MAG: CRTAC1 family protein [Planctomycetes bacterium]|nr:CRTAC1 family protein [Planctomycetota bacterium]
MHARRFSVILALVALVLTSRAMAAARALSLQSAPPAASAPSASPAFVDVSERALPGVVTHCGATTKDYIVEVNGGGLALADFDGDRRVDLVVVDGSDLDRVKRGAPGHPPRLFLGNGDGTFRPGGEAWAMAGGRWGMGAAVGDLDGDGWLDLVITQWGPNRVLLNQQGKGFRELGAESGFVGAEWSTSAAVLDFDRDDKLDLVVVRYLVFDPDVVPKRGAEGCRWKGHDVMCGPEGLAPVFDQLYRGRGDGTFVERTKEAGMTPKEAGFGLGVMPLDYDADGDSDLFVANDSTPNHLWENRGDGTFAEVAYARGVSHDVNGREQASMGIACADWNADGRPDLFVTNFSGESDSFYVSGKSGGYRERSSAAGLAGPTLSLLGWGTALADLDLDGDLDLVTLNGHVYPEADLPGTDTSYAQRDLLLRNDGKGRFQAEPLSAAGPAVSRASALADLDDDGDLDLVALRVEGSVRVLSNAAAHDGARHWLRVALRARGGNRFGIGARITAEGKNLKQVAELRTSGGYQASVPPEVHFGLGAVAKLERLVIRWPSGKEQVLEGVDVDRVLVVEEAP